jgi:hypothetical protein
LESNNAFKILLSGLIQAKWIGVTLFPGIFLVTFIDLNSGNYLAFLAVNTAKCKKFIVWPSYKSFTSILMKNVLLVKYYNKSRFPVIAT